MPASLITLPQSAVSSAKNFAVSDGLVAPTSSDSLCSRAVTSGLRSIATASRLIRCASAAGVPGGAAVEPVGYGARRSGGGDEADPGDRAEPRHARLGERRQFRRRLGALQIGD